MHYGDIRLGDTIDIKFTTRQISGAPATLAGTPVVSAYVGNGTTEITAGITLTVDFDARTGLNNVRVVATSGNGFATATNVQLVITTGTVNSVSVVGEVVGTFSIEARSAIMPTVAARTLDVSAGGNAGVDWANVEAPTTTLALTGTTIATTQKVDVETIKTQTVTAAAGVTFPTSIASPTNITAATGITLTPTTGLGSQTGPVATVTTLTNLPAITANWLTATGIAADAITDAKVASDVTIASVTGAVGSVTGAVGSVTGAVGSVTANVNAVLANTAHGGAAATMQLGGAGGLTGAVTGSLSGSVGSVTGAVGSVTGAVGSVTGNVGGNVVGSVGSVTGAVGSVTGAVGSVTGAVGSVTAVSSGAITEASFATNAGSFAPLGIIDQGTMQAGSTSTTAVLRSALSIADDLILGAQLAIVSGAGAGQTRTVSDWVSTTDTATVDAAWVATPDNTSVYKLFFGSPGPTAPPAVNVTQVIGDPIIASSGKTTNWGGTP